MALLIPLYVTFDSLQIRVAAVTIEESRWASSYVLESMFQARRLTAQHITVSLRSAEAC